jgi:hypothetical protein
MKDEAPLAKPRGMVTVDYPQEGEVVSSPNYSIRISAPQDAKNVELCINQSPWLPCRQAGGYWWFDCTDISSKPYQVRARMRSHDGKVKLTMLRRFQANC